MVALRAAKQLGIRCPQELAVVSVNDDPYFCETARPPLSSIRYPGRQAGYTVSALLQDLMDGRIHDDGAIHLRLPPGPLVRRESTGQIELEDPVIRKSLEIIRRETANGKVSVDKLARRVGVSRELLRQRFLAVLGRGPKQEVDFARLAYLESQLATTNLTLESLAEEAGFSGPDDLSRFFKRMKGQSPGEFRRIFRASG
jgi:LacI family transcriptional regulator